MAHPGWLSNKVIEVEVPGRGSFQTRVLGVRKDVVVVAAPAQGGELTWLPKASRLHLKVAQSEEGNLPAGASTQPAFVVEATVVDRKLKPMPILFLRFTTDLPFSVAATERPNKIVVVTSGKGGTGKTFLSVNLAYAWAASAMRVALVDGDIGTANVSTALGLRPERDLTAVIDGRLRLRDIGVDTRFGITVLPGIIGDMVSADLSPWQFSRIISGLGELEGDYDQVIVDTGAGVSRNVTGLLYVADFIVLVINDAPTSIVDAYGLLKLISSQYWVPEIGLVVNRVLDTAETAATVERFLRTAREYLAVPVSFLGYVREDGQVLRSLKAASPVGAHSPQSLAAGDIGAVAGALRERLAFAADGRHLRSMGDGPRPHTR